MNDLLVLCYHGISESWPADTSVRPAEFEEQLAELTRLGYRGATLVDALGQESSSERTLVVTFDDAHRSVLEHAPIMARLGIPGPCSSTVYVGVAGHGMGRLRRLGGHRVRAGASLHGLGRAARSRRRAGRSGHTPAPILGCRRSATPRSS